jgi:cytochrome c-type biogenesis protein
VENISIWVAFSGGLLSFLSPCVLPLVPVYFATFYGGEVFDSGAGGKRFTLLKHSFAFVLGFSVVFSALGAIAGITGYAINLSTATLSTIAGSLLVLFGILMLLALKVPWLNYEKRLHPSLGKKTGYLRSFLIGGTLSMGWTACVGYILAGILALAAVEATAWRGAFLLAVYSLGLGLPFIIIGAAFDRLTPLLRKLQRYSRWIYVFSGLLLIAVGIMVLTNKILWLASLTG